MADWVEESPSDEDDLSNIENELYSMFYYHSMSDGLPDDLAKKFDVDKNEFGVTISLKDRSSDAQKVSDKFSRNGSSKSEQFNRANDRYIDGRNDSDTINKNINYSNDTNSRGEEPEVRSESLNVPSLTLKRTKSSFSKSRYFSTETINCSKENPILYQSKHSNIPNNYYKKTFESLSDAEECSTILFNKNIGSYQKKDCKIISKKYVNSHPKKKNQIVDLTLEHNENASKSNIEKSMRKRYDDKEVIAISSDSESEDSSSTVDVSDSTNFDSDSDGNGETFDSILLNTSTPSYLDSYEAAIINIDYDWRQTSSPDSWTKSMKKFYNKPSKKHLDFDYKAILQEIRNKGTGTWTICQADLYRSRSSRHIRCIRCQEEGHVKANCTKIFSCHMCGVQGHSSKSCPNLICLKCGSKCRGSFLHGCASCAKEEKGVCSLCGAKGHTAKICTDAWRILQPIDNKNKNKMKTKPKYCCNCGKSGHYYEDCSKKRIHQLNDLHGHGSRVNNNVGRSIRGKRRRRFSEVDFNDGQTLLPSNKHRRTKKIKFHSKMLNTFKNPKHFYFPQSHSNEKTKNRNHSKRILMLRKANKKKKFKTYFSPNV